MTWPAPDYQTPMRMALKERAIPLPDLEGRSVLDIGCDFGYWSFLSARRGARRVVGLDRNRTVRGVGHVDLIARNRAAAEESDVFTVCQFEQLNLGRQWHAYGRFDVVFLFSLYHHIFANCGDHLPIWYWLWQHTHPEGELLWENPVDLTDPVADISIPAPHRARYRREEILIAAGVYFEAECIGPALHEPTREVWRFRPKRRSPTSWDAVMRDGAGGATKAFQHEAGRRIWEVETALGVRPVPGSLNLLCDRRFDWDNDYYRASILDVVDRAAGLGSAWAPRWARLYPVTIDGRSAHAFRFEGERYDERFVELIAPRRLRDTLGGAGRCRLMR